MSKPKIKITLADRIGNHGCHRGHKIGDTFDYNTERGKLCPMAMHVVFPYIDILRYGGTPPTAIRVRSDASGISHGLKSIHRILFTPVCTLIYCMVATGNH